MKKQISLGLTVVMMTTAAMAVGPKGPAKMQEHEKKASVGGHSTTSATAKSKEATELATKRDAIAKRFGIDSMQLAAGMVKEADIEINVRKDPNDTSKTPELVKKTIRIKGSEMFEKLQSKLESGEGDPAAIELGFSLIAQMANTSSGARQGETKSSAQILAHTREFYKFTHDYVNTVTRKPSANETKEDIKEETASYVELATGFTTYSKSNTNAKVDEIYENGVPKDARERQKECEG